MRRSRAFRSPSNERSTSAPARARAPVGADVSADMLAQARKLVPQVAFIEADAARLPFDDESFDVVAHANMIPFLDEIARVLRPGGWTLFAFSAGPETPIWVEPAVLRRELERRGFTDFAEIAAARGNAVLARRRDGS